MTEAIVGAGDEADLAPSMLWHRDQLPV